MFQPPNVHADVENTTTWAKYSKKLCNYCSAVCCSLAVEVKAQDLIRLELMDEFELEDNPKKIAKRMIKQGVIEHYHSKTGTFTLSRMANGDCFYLDQKSRRCTVYHSRPDTCRNHPQIGPRAGYCAFQPKDS